MSKKFRYCLRTVTSLMFVLFQETGEEGGHSSEDSGHCSPEPESEFLKVHTVVEFQEAINFIVKSSIKF